MCFYIFVLERLSPNSPARTPSLDTNDAKGSTQAPAPFQDFGSVQRIIPNNCITDYLHIQLDSARDLGLLHNCLFMPYGSVHQHFNQGEDTVRYFSAMALPLERFAGIVKVMQYEEVGETPSGEPQGVRMAESDIHPEYGRIVLRLKDAPVVSAKEEGEFRAKREDEFTLTMAITCPYNLVHLLS